MDQFIRTSVKTSLIEDVWNVKEVLDFVPVLEDLGENRIVKRLAIIGNINYRWQVQLLTRTQWVVELRKPTSCKENNSVEAI